MVRECLTALVAALGLACGNSVASSADGGLDSGFGGANDAGVDAPNDAPNTSVRKIVFAADFDSNGGCADHSETDRCDLYTAQLNLSDGNVSEVKRATNTTVSESYPALHPNGNVAYFSVFKDVKHKDLGFVDLATGTTGVLKSDASWPSVHPSGDTLLFKDGAADLLMTAPLTANGLLLGNALPLTGVKNQEDPTIRPMGATSSFTRSRQARVRWGKCLTRKS